MKPRRPTQSSVHRARESAPATANQVNYLIGLGVSAAQASAMTIKQASATIDELLRARRAGGRR